MIIEGDCREVLKTLPDNSVDSIVTDPPYELGFMGKSWDSTGIAYDVTVWQECLRVLKPGGHLLAFGGSRTYHRLAVAIEDAGFQIRDQIMWVYGSEFPKSHNVANSIDKMMGQPNRGRAIPTASKYQASDIDEKNKLTSNKVDAYVSRTPESAEGEGWGTALKPAHEPIVMARKPLEGTVANNVLTHGVGGINIDASRVETTDNFDNVKDRTDMTGKLTIHHEGGNLEALDKLKTLGRFPANFIHDGSDEVLELFPNSKGGAFPKKSNIPTGRHYEGGWGAVDNGVRTEMGDGSAARFFYCAKANKKVRNEGLDGFDEQWQAGEEFRPNHMEKALEGESGNPFGRWQPTKNHHPTVKPTDLMRYLVRLVTPPNGTVLDPFTGSGSTGKAAVLEGFSFIGIEQSAEYVEIATARIKWAKEPKDNTLQTLFDEA